MNDRFDSRRKVIAPGQGGTLPGVPGGTGVISRMLRELGRRGEQGNAMIETALVLPMLLGIITAIFGFGIGYNNQLTLTSAVGSSAQRLQLLRNTTTDPCLDAFTAITSAAPGLNSSKITMTYSFNGTAVTPVQNSCSGEQTLLVSGQPVTVTAKYPCAPPVYGATLSSSCQLSATVTEYEY